MCFIFLPKIKRQTGLMGLFILPLLAFGGLIGPMKASAEELPQVRITEFIADPSVVTDTNGEWVEVQNTGVTNVDMSGWDVDGSTIQGDILLAAGQSAVICRNDDALTNDGVICDSKATGFSLVNSGDTVNLRDENNVVVDSLSYGASDVETGHSTAVKKGALQVENNYQYSVNNFGTPANNSTITGEVRVHSVIDANQNMRPDFNEGESHQAGWAVRLYGLNAETPELVREVETTGLAYWLSAKMLVPAGDYAICQVEKSGYEQNFVRKINSYTQLPEVGVPNVYGTEDEGQSCALTTVGAGQISSYVFGNAEL